MYHRWRGGWLRGSKHGCLARLVKLGGSLRIVTWIIGDFEQIIAGNSAQFGTDVFGGETGAKQIPIERSDLLLVKRAAKLSEAAFEARADESGFVGICEDGGEC